MMPLSISEREREVLRLISDEMTNGEIARSLFISQHTVISHRRSLLSKFNAKNSVGLVRRAFEYGILQVRTRRYEPTFVWPSERTN